MWNLEIFQECLTIYGEKFFPFKNIETYLLRVRIYGEKFSQQQLQQGKNLQLFKFNPYIFINSKQPTWTIHYQFTQYLNIFQGSNKNYIISRGKKPQKYKQMFLKTRPKYKQILIQKSNQYFNRLTLYTCVLTLLIFVFRKLQVLFFSLQKTQVHKKTKRMFFGQPKKERSVQNKRTFLRLPTTINILKSQKSQQNFHWT
eukprot:TRINITY_DN1111_c1_g1_i2.p1 TRINITY_DN1111_c1_g1~~TRINITY_DN1111_c1_g1_i2.p1  ORF type:complete len:200 (+),score=-10.45 TRINITY_DN1111_c1_g1_i2:757-1356(+)